MSPRDDELPTYPVVDFLVAHGFGLALLIGFVPLLVSFYLAASGWSGMVVLLGAVAGVVVGALLVSYVEVLRIIADTLMPK